MFALFDIVVVKEATTPTHYVIMTISDSHVIINTLIQDGTTEAFISKFQRIISKSDLLQLFKVVGKY